MDDALGNPFVVEVEDLLSEVKIVDEGRTTGADTQRVLIVGDRSALSGRQKGLTVLRELMEFAALTSMELLVVDCGGRQFRACFGSRRLLGHGESSVMFVGGRHARMKRPPSKGGLIRRTKA
jgi:hypothetical protein